MPILNKNYLNNFEQVRVELTAVAQAYIANNFPHLYHSATGKIDENYKTSPYQILNFLRFNGIHGKEGFNRAKLVIESFGNARDVNELLNIAINQTGDSQLHERFIDHLLEKVITCVDDEERENLEKIKQGFGIGGVIFYQAAENFLVGFLKEHAGIDLSPLENQNSVAL